MKIGAIIMFSIAGFMLADVVANPKGTQAAGGVITSLWNTTAKGVSGQKIT